MVLTYGFEPEPEEAKNLNKNFPSRKNQPYAAADKDGYLRLTVANDPGCSSIYHLLKYIEDSFLIENATNRYTTKTVEISRRIDSVVEDVDFIKIDTQGYEYEVLSGASKILPNVPAILTECWSVPIHKGQHLTHDVTKLMYDQQFEVLSIENGSWHVFLQGINIQLLVCKKFCS